MHSIVAQGKVDAVLASKPEDRRALVEEAAGLGKFKRRRHRAELKLARVATQVERARDVEDEVRKRLRPLALQATAAERAEKLAVEIAGLRARLARLDLAALDARRADADERRTAASLARRSRRGGSRRCWASARAPRSSSPDAAGARESALGALYRLQGAGERLTVRGESVAGLAARLHHDLSDAELAAQARTDETLRALEDAARTAAAAARDAATRSGHATERARHAHALLAAAERAVADEADSRLEAVRREREAVDRGMGELTGGHGEPTARSSRWVRRGSGFARARRPSPSSPASSALTTTLPAHTRGAAPRARPSSSSARTRRGRSRAPPPRSATTSRSAPAPPGSGSPRSSGRSPSGKASHRLPARWPQRGSGWRSRRSRSSPGSRRRSRPRWHGAPLRFSRAAPSMRWRCSSAPAPTGSAACRS